MEVLLKPIVTEKMTGQADKLNRYGFFVDKKANKLQIKKAVQDLYGVTVKEVNTMHSASKIKYRYTRTGVLEGKTKGFKKAIITLAQGEVIDFYSNI